MKTLFGALCLALSLSACDGGTAGDAGKSKAATSPTATTVSSSAAELRVYQVPPEQTEAVVDALNKVFDNGDKSATGKVSSPAPGQVVVLAPGSLQGSVEASLRALTASQAPPADDKVPPIQIRLSFWSVDALPEDGTDDLELVTIAPALDEVRKQLGGVRFLLRDQVSAVSSPGKKVERSWLGTKLTTDSQSPLHSLEYQLRPVGDQYMLDLHIGEQMPVIQGGSVSYIGITGNTSTAIRLGQTLVVTQTPIPRNAMTNGEVSLADRATRLYIVRADQVPPGAGSG
jgi:hypothetical protein